MSLGVIALRVATRISVNIMVHGLGFRVQGLQLRLWLRLGLRYFRDLCNNNATKSKRVLLAINRTLLQANAKLAD